MHKLTVGTTGNIGLGPVVIHLSNGHAGQAVTAIRDHDRVTVYTAAGEPIGHIKLDHHKRYQGTLHPAA